MRCAIVALVAACGQPAAPIKPTTPPVAASATVTPIDAPAISQDEKLAAIQKAMNDLSPEAQACWAAAATERFDIEGELQMHVDIASGSAVATIAHDTTKSPRLDACMIGLLANYRWAPPLAGEAIELPFKFTAPDGQSVIDRRMVDWHAQGKVSVAVLLDENNTGNGAASMFEIAIVAGEHTGLRKSERAELWYFLAPAEVSVIGVPHMRMVPVAAGDMVYVPAVGVRDVRATTQDVHAVIVAVPGGREGAARAGALSTPPISSGRMDFPIVLPAGSATQFGPVTIFAEPKTIHDATLAASILALPAGAKVPEHVHANETEMLYMLEGSGTLTVAGTDVAVGPTSVIQIPPNTKHAFAAHDPMRALQIYTPAGPEQRFKK